MGKNTLQAWFMATRPWSFTASALTVLVALVYLEWAEGGVDWLKGMWAVVAVVLFQAAGNTWSDWHDYRRGIDAPDTHGVDTLTSGKFTPAEILGLSLALYAAAIAVGITLMICTGAPLLWIGALGFLGAVFYPPLKFHALGDAVIMLNYCLLPALGTSYVALGRFQPAVLWVVLPVGVLVAAILHANNTRDMSTDRRAHARTLAHVLGVRGAVAFYLFEVVFSFGLVVVLVVAGMVPVAACVTLLLLPIAWRNCRLMLAYRSEADAAVIRSLDQLSAQLQLLFSVVFILSLGVDLWFR